MRMIVLTLSLMAVALAGCSSTGAKKAPACKGEPFRINGPAESGR